MTRVVVLLLAIPVLKIMLPRRVRRTNTSITPYGSVFDVPVPADLACSSMWYAPGQTRRKHEHTKGER